MKLKIRPLFFAIIIAAFALFFVFEALSSQHLTYHFSFVGYGGTLKNHNISILGIPMYWFLMLIGLLVTIILSLKSKKFYNIHTAKAVVLPIIFIVISYIGAKILYLLENFASTRKFSLEIDGLSLYGAIFFVLIFTPLISLVFKIKTRALYDYFTPFGLVLLSFVRTGCFFNGCCEAVTLWDGNNPIILPVQLFEVCFDLLILDYCFKIKNKYPQSGLMYPCFMLLYGICRFVLEFLRKGNDVFLIFSTGQIFSVISVVVSVLLFFILKKSSKS